MTDSLLGLVFEYGYVGLFLAMALGLVGIPVPDEALLTAAGYLMTQGHMKLGFTMLAAIGGSLTGMSLSYLLGRWLGRPLLTKLGPLLRLTPDKLARHEARFSKWGQVLVLVGYFVPGLRHMTALFIGLGKHPYRPFLFYASLGALAWTSTFELIGVLLGEHWRESALFVQREAVTAFLLLVGMGGLLLLVRRYSLRRNNG
ncbi:DedA family protein [Cohnella hashimotonis]|uniref:DedA family protein n=1 Tax=Cohnella hashimotonis TaxID=2826895 RepID=A0ABT6TI01_9BACL|nr:DedA family protein [Cohnella hashimotonis]MDI4646461.1 DedA family protein [Cohnella hashimotonis]